MEIKMVLIEILRKYKFVQTSDTQVSIVYYCTLIVHVIILTMHISICTNVSILTVHISILCANVSILTVQISICANVSKLIRLVIPQFLIRTLLPHSSIHTRVGSCIVCCRGFS